MPIRHGARPRIDEILARIESASRVRGVVRAIEAPRVADTGRKSLNEDVPEEEASIVLRHERDRLERLGARSILEQQ
jgi:hypothetical protein